MRYMDVHLELNPHQLKRQGNPLHVIAEASKHTAETQARQAGCYLRHTEPGEVHVRTATTPTGTDVLLVATRWVIDGLEHIN